MFRVSHNQDHLSPLIGSFVDNYVNFLKLEGVVQPPQLFANY